MGPVRDMECWIPAVLPCTSSPLEGGPYCGVIENTTVGSAASHLGMMMSYGLDAMSSVRGDLCVYGGEGLPDNFYCDDTHTRNMLLLCADSQTRGG